MYNYLYTNDMRISDLPNSIKRVSEILLSGMEPYQVDKSFGNNGATIQFYFNLQDNTETLIKGKDATLDVIRNFILKFQFPNTRTLESFRNTLNDKILFAPYRAIISVLYKLALNEGNTSYLTHDEILFFFFCNSDVCTNPSFDIDELINSIVCYRNNPYDIISSVRAKIKWNQYERQLREMMTVLQYASSVFKNRSGTLSFVIPTSTDDITFINNVISYNRIWYPSNIEDFNLSNKEYISYMDTANTPYYVIELDKSHKANSSTTNESLQQIYYGCPGSGKSHHVKDITENVDSNFVFRTTFHPDTDYASFVGCYKPCSSNRSLLIGNNLTEDELLQRFFDSKDEDKYKGDIKARYLYESLINAIDIKNLGENASTIADKLKSKGFDKTAYVTEANCMYKIHNWLKEEGYLVESNITYEFLPQVFTNAYIKAWKNPEEKVYLVIEEINRGNCAQIFGDLFQLLDRDKETGKSEYPIKADKDLVAHIEKVLGAGHEGIKNGELCLPPNLIIYATMNTSDQSLFPMDSAFKRRWDWEYVPINYSKDIDSGKFIIEIDDDTKYSWVEFLESVNDKIYNATNSEDKQMGNFFIKKSIKANEFVNKVMFYLWNEVCKEECGTQRNFFRKGKDGKTEFKFTELFGDNQATILKEFMTSLGVEPIGKKPEEPAAE